MQVTPYLGFNGQCAAAFKFYEQCLGGKLVAMHSFAETPAAEHVPADWRDRIMHAQLDLGGAALMGSDSPSADRYQKPAGIYVSLHIDTPAEAERVFRELSEGGTVEMPIQETFWAERFAMFTDRFGTPWMINCSKTG
jgi:PhnB protein